MFRERDSTVYLPKDLERFVAEEYIPFPIDSKFVDSSLVNRQSSF